MFAIRASTLPVLALLGLGARLVSAQTLDLDSGVHTYASLANTAITLSGRCELQVTAASNPIPGCTVNLTSLDALFILPNIRPSIVMAGYLGQIKVSGATAVAGDNLQVVAYADGTLLLPHPSSIKPLETFSEPHFLGETKSFGLYTYHTARSLGSLEDRISSFRLKRGYMATLAANANGSGASKVFVAQDADLDVSVLPEGLDNATSFIRVFPWRWTGRKGWAGGKETLVAPLWHYDWDNATTSSPDIEYVPMRHNLNWNAYANINNKQDSTHVLGFNEPDRPDQANMTVQQALDQWPNLLASGLRLGAPAPSDAASGVDWLYAFIDQADALGYRVDYVPVHFYKGGWSATQFHNWLLDIHNRTGRPVWITEFNNGANWTCCEPTPESQAQIVGEFIDMLDKAPFVERYSIYNWVGVNRELVTGGSLTPAGVVYRDNRSPLAYAQEAPSRGAKGIAQYRFENDLLDTSGFGNNAVPAPLPSFVPGPDGQSLEFDGTNDFVRLPAGVGGGVDFTFAAWLYWNGGASWQRIFDFGSGTSQYMFLTPSSAGGSFRFAVTTNGGAGEQIVSAPALPIGQWTHIAFTLSRSTGQLYVNGSVVGASSSINLNPVDLKLSKSHLGKSQYAADALFNGRLDDVVILDKALSSAQITHLMNGDQPPQFASKQTVGANGTESQPYSGSIAGTATDPDAGDSVSYQKASGPSWLTVASNGDLGGTPPNGSGDQNTFVLRAIDSAGMSDFTVMTIAVLPPPPANLTTVADDGQVTLGWTAVASAASYQVKRSTTSGGPYDLLMSGIGGTSAIDSNATNGTRYFYVVTAVGAAGESAPSPEAVALPTSTVPPEAASFLAGNEFTIEWPPANTGWQLQMTTNLTGAPWVIVPEATFTNRFTLPTTNANAFFRLIRP